MVMQLDDDSIWSEYASDASEALGAIEAALLILEDCARPQGRDRSAVPRAAHAQGQRRLPAAGRDREAGPPSPRI
jgi:hypothetical protein